MDKRAIIFLILSVAILYLYSYYEFQKERSRLDQIQPRPPAEEPLPPAVVDQEGEAKSREGRELPRELAVGAEPVAEQEIVVETDLYRAVLSNRGGVIKRWELKEYRTGVTRDSARIVLYQEPKNRSGILPLQVVVGDGTDRYFAESLYEVEGESMRLEGEDRSKKLVFIAKDPGAGRYLRKELTFHSDRYDVGVKVEAGGFTQDYTLFVGTNFAILDWGERTFVSFVGPTSLVDGRIVKDKPSEIEGSVSHTGQMAWTALQDKYFMAALIPEKGADAVVAVENGEKRVSVGLRQRPDPVAGVHSYRFYAGPKEFDRLKSYRLNLEEMIDFGWFIYGSWSMVRLIAQPLFSVLRLFHDFTNNYGVAIILLTASIKLLFVPLTHKSYVSMKGMQELQPKVAALQKKYKNDRQKLQQELMDLYRKNKVNPLGGCLPMVLQIPVFIALFNILYTTIELRHAPFALWIRDLSDKDPYYVMPIVMGISMIVQQKLQPTAMDPRQARILMFLPVVFTYFFLFFPSGLVLYWLVNNCLSILQQYITLKYIIPKKA